MNFEPTAKVVYHKTGDNLFWHGVPLPTGTQPAEGELLYLERDVNVLMIDIMTLEHYIKCLQDEVNDLKEELKDYKHVY
jgi:hypothetical protein